MESLLILQLGMSFRNCRYRSNFVHSLMIVIGTVLSARASLGKEENLVKRIKTQLPLSSFYPSHLLVLGESEKRTTSRSLRDPLSLPFRNLFRNSRLSRMYAGGEALGVLISRDGGRRRGGGRTVDDNDGAEPPPQCPFHGSARTHRLYEGVASCPSMQRHDRFCLRQTH